MNIGRLCAFIKVNAGKPDKNMDASGRPIPDSD